MAENMFGVSEPSKASVAATTKEPLPFINYEDFGECDSAGFTCCLQSLVKVFLFCFCFCFFVFCKLKEKKYRKKYSKIIQIRYGYFQVLYLLKILQ